MHDTQAQYPPVDIVGTGEIAERCKVSHDLVRKWTSRGHLPAPDGAVGGRPWWHWGRVAELSPMAAKAIAAQRLTSTVTAPDEAPTPEDKVTALMAALEDSVTAAKAARHRHESGGELRTEGT